MTTIKHIVFLITAFLPSVCFSQLSAVYVRDFEERNRDTLETVINGQVIDKKTKLPITSVTVELFSSAGESLGVKTDGEGKFMFRGIQGDGTKGKVICSLAPYPIQTWEYNTLGTSKPTRFYITFEIDTTIK